MFYPENTCDIFIRFQVKAVTYFLWLPSDILGIFTPKPYSEVNVNPFNSFEDYQVWNKMLARRTEPEFKKNWKMHLKFKNLWVSYKHKEHELIYF